MIVKVSIREYICDHTIMISSIVKCSICLFFLVNSYAAGHAQIEYPVPAKVNQVDNYHGVSVPDPYRWLEDDSSEATRTWLAEENKITAAYLESIPFRGKLKNRMAAFYNYTRYSAPFRNASYYYYYRNDGLQNFAVLYRQKINDTAVEKIIDPNTFSTDASIQLTDFIPSHDGRYAAWGISDAGSDWQTFFVKDLSTLKDLADTIKWAKVSEIAWQNNGFYYSRYPEPEKGKELSSVNANQQVWYHTAGTPQSADKLIYEDAANPYRFYYVYTSEDGRFVFLSIQDRGKGLLGNALLYSDMLAGDKRFKPIVPEVGEYLYGVIDPLENGKFLIQTNDHAPNGKIVLFDPSSTSSKKWTTIIPERKETLKFSSMAGGKLFVQYLKNVASEVYVYTPKGKLVKQVKLPGLGTTSGFEGLRDDSVVFYTYNSFNYPTHIYKYDIATGKTSLYRKPEISFDPEDYVVSQEFFTSRDGAKVPMFIVHRKDVVPDGNNPTLMYGYGGFNISIEPQFSASLMPWLEQGGIYASVTLRGGGEYGEAWHKAGMLDKKQNVFDDFIGAANYLIKKKYTSPAKLAVRGASNGGLLIGAVINQCPDLFKVAIPEVGVMDMLRFQHFTIGWNWIAEYGSSENKKQFETLYKYSPLHNIRAGVKYPATMIVTADHDDRVVPAHSFKYTATLQEKAAGTNPILLKIDENSGHGYSSIMKNIELTADIYSFILFNMNVPWKDVK